MMTVISELVLHKICLLSNQSWIDEGYKGPYPLLLNYRPLFDLGRKEVIVLGCMHAYYGACQASKDSSKPMVA